MAHGLHTPPQLNVGENVNNEGNKIIRSTQMMANATQQHNTILAKNQQANCPWDELGMEGFMRYNLLKFNRDTMSN